MLKSIGRICNSCTWIMHTGTPHTQEARRQMGPVVSINEPLDFRLWTHLHWLRTQVALYQPPVKVPRSFISILSCRLNSNKPEERGRACSCSLVVFNISLLMLLLSNTLDDKIFYHKGVLIPEKLLKAFTRVCMSFFFFFFFKKSLFYRLWHVR